MNKMMNETIYTVLLVEDNVADIILLEEAMDDSGLNINLQVAQNGEEALNYLHRREPYGEADIPALILLDLNLPKTDGFTVLEEIKQDQKLMQIPVIVLSTSQSEADINRSYRLHANCFITKPLGLDQFITVVGSIGSFWLHTVMLPTR
jgi:chemotaxis family two-component system response regulator Rcp1